VGGPESVSSTRIYQLKVFLREISPMIWRRSLVSGDTTLLELHEIIQSAMGWEGYHLWTFSINGHEYGHAYGAALGRETYETTLSDLGLRVREVPLHLRLRRLLAARDALGESPGAGARKELPEVHRRQAGLPS
jgi:hypothetical protein